MLPFNYSFSAVKTTEREFRNTMDDLIYFLFHSSSALMDPSSKGNSSISDNQSFYSAAEISIMRQIEKYVTILFCIFGLVGNSFASATFLSKNLRRSPCSMYLAVRGFSDNLFLANLLLGWLVNSESDIPGLCNWIVFSTYASGFVSVWLTVLVTLENLVLLNHPQKAKKFNRSKFYQRICLAVIVVAVMVYFILFWLVGNNCTYTKESASLVYIFVVLDMIITFAIPTLIIIVLLVLTVMKVSRLLSTRARTYSSCSDLYGSLQKLKPRRKPKPPTAKVTIMLFVFTSSFMLLHVPSHILRSYIVTSSLLNISFPVGTSFIYLHSVFQLMYNLSFSINMLVFIGFGSNFRKLFQHNFCGFRTDFTVTYVPVQVLNVARARRPTKVRRHTIAANVAELASITLSREWFNLQTLERTYSQ